MLFTLDHTLQEYHDFDHLKSVVDGLKNGLNLLLSVHAKIMWLAHRHAQLKWVQLFLPIHQSVLIVGIFTSHYAFDVVMLPKFVLSSECTKIESILIVVVPKTTHFDGVSANLFLEEGNAHYFCESLLFYEVCIKPLGRVFEQVEHRLIKLVPSDWGDPLFLCLQCHEYIDQSHLFCVYHAKRMKFYFSDLRSRTELNATDFSCCISRNEAEIHLRANAFEGGDYDAGASRGMPMPISHAHGADREDDYAAGASRGMPMPISHAHGADREDKAGKARVDLDLQTGPLTRSRAPTKHGQELVESEHKTLTSPLSLILFTTFSTHSYFIHPPSPLSTILFSHLLHYLLFYSPPIQHPMRNKSAPTMSTNENSAIQMNN